MKPTAIMLFALSLVTNSAFAEQLKVVASDMKSPLDIRHPIPPERVANLAIAFLKITLQYLEFPEAFKSLDYSSVYVASIIDKDKNFYFFVGIPYQDRKLGGSEILLQNCDGGAEFVLGSAGRTTDYTNTSYERFRNSQGRIAPDTENWCKDR